MYGTPEEILTEGGRSREESDDHRGCHCTLDRNLLRKRYDHGEGRSEGSHSGEPVQRLRTGAVQPFGAHFHGGRMRRLPPPARQGRGEIVFGMPPDRPVHLQKEHRRRQAQALRGMSPGVR